VKSKQKTNTLQRVKKTFHRHLKLAFVPHKGNQYRPHLVRRYGIMTMLLLIIAIQAGYNFSTTGKVLGEKMTVSEATLLEDTNNERAKQQLAPLKIDAKLAQAAYLKGQDMLKQQYWAHNAPDGTTPWQWFKNVGYDYSYAGENLAKNFHTADAVTTAWMASAEHEANIMNIHYSQVGFAVVSGDMNDKPVTLVVALYGAPASNVASTASVQSTGSSAPINQSVGIVTRFGMAIQSMTPAVIGSVVVLLFAAFVAFMAHTYRDKLPKGLRQSWHRHHGLMKAGGMLSLCLIMVFLYSGGQI
jgi:uncharacterized protein YkwD